MRTIWLASYPKSGNTWMRLLIANLSAKDGVPADINDMPPSGGLASARGPFEDLLMIDSGLLTPDEADCLRPRVYEELARRARDDDDNDDDPDDRPAVRFVKVHDAYTLTPKGEPLLAGARGADGAIVIVRDPRDVAVSLASYSQIALDDAIDYMENPDAGLCTSPTRQYNQFRQKLPGWSGHVASWLDQSDIPVHLIRYEDLKAYTFAALRRALVFSGSPANDEDISRAVSFADFGRLQRQEREKGFRESPPARSNWQFFRRGEAGAWRSELSRDQIARIEAGHAPMMRRLGYALSSVDDLARVR